MPRQFSGPARLALDAYLGARRTWYRLRYPRRLTMGTGVAIVGTLRIARGTRVHLGDHVVVRKPTTINGGGVVTVGAHTRLVGPWLGAHERIEIGEWCLVSDCRITDTDFHNAAPAKRHAPNEPRVVAPVRLGRNVWIGAQAMVLKGSTIGADSVVGAGAVVRGEVQEGVVVIGNPAVVVKTFTRSERFGDDGRLAWTTTHSTATETPSSSPP